MYATRREWMRSTLGTASLLASGLTVPGFVARTARAAAAGPRGGNVLVVVQLTGGNDGLNTVIPYADPLYEQNRIVLRINKPQVIRMDDHVGLHPRLRKAHELLERGWLSVVQGVGYPNPNRSHFRSMDIWHSAQPENDLPRDGWLGRALDGRAATADHDLPALHLGRDVLPLALTSRHTVVPSIQSIEGMRLSTRAGAPARTSLQSLAEVPRDLGNELLDFVGRSTLAAYAASEQVAAASRDSATDVPWPTHSLARKLKPIAQLIDAGLETPIYYVSLDGFDTHANQPPAHANLLGEWAESLSAFAAELSARGQWDRVCVLTFSEFGRRVKENASQGTDHGTAAPVFLAGGQVAGGVMGAHPSLAELDQGDLKFHTDFRGIYATLLDRWLGIPSREVLGKTWQPLPLFG